MKNNGLDGENYVIFISDGCPTTTFATEDIKDKIASIGDGRGWLTWLPLFDFPAWIVSVIGSVIEVKLENVEVNDEGNPIYYASKFKLVLVGDLAEGIGKTLNTLGFKIQESIDMGWVSWESIASKIFPSLVDYIPSDWKQIIENGYDGKVDGVNNSSSKAKGGVLRLIDEYQVKIFTIAFDTSEAKFGLDYIASLSNKYLGEGQSYAAADYDELEIALREIIGHINGGPSGPAVTTKDYTVNGTYDLGEEKVLVKLIINNDEENHSYDKTTLEGKGWQSGNELNIKKMREDLKKDGITLYSVKIIYC